MMPSTHTMGATPNLVLLAELVKVWPELTDVQRAELIETAREMQGEARDERC